MKEYSTFLENRSVALVGPAEYLVNSSYGEEIDNHDVVVRVNRGIELMDDYERDIGKRSDILYSCLIEKPANAGKLDGGILKEKYGVKFVCAPPESTFEGISFKTKFHSLVKSDTVRDISAHMPIRIVEHDFHTALAQRVSCRPNTGFLAIYDILRFKPSRLSIYGFSFYLDGFIPGCKKGIIKEQNKDEKQFADQCFTSKRHIQKNMWQFAKQTLLDNGTIRPDPVLRKILNLNKLDRELFAELKNDESFYTYKA